MGTLWRILLTQKNLCRPLGVDQGVLFQWHLSCYFQHGGMRGAVHATGDHGERSVPVSGRHPTSQEQVRWRVQSDLQGPGQEYDRDRREVGSPHELYSADVSSKCGERYSPRSGKTTMFVRIRLGVLSFYLGSKWQCDWLAFIQVQYQVNEPNLSWAKIFGTMESIKEQFFIEDYSVSQTTLEQVFLNFARAQRPPRELRDSCGKRCGYCCKFVCCCRCCMGNRSPPQVQPMQGVIVVPAAANGAQPPPYDTNVGYSNPGFQDQTVSYTPDGGINMKM